MINAVELAAIKLRAEARNYVEAVDLDDCDGETTRAELAWINLREAALAYAHEYNRASERDKRTQRSPRENYARRK
jgi:hypothetical protein